MSEHASTANTSIDHGWRYVGIQRKVTGSGVGVLTIAHKDGRVVEMPLFPETLRLMAVEAITAMAPDTGRGADHG